MNDDQMKPQVESENEQQETEDESDDRLAPVLSLLPVQDAPYTGHRDLKVKRGPGRPRKVERMPTTNDLEYHAAMAKARRDYVESDPLVKAVDTKADPIEILFHVKSSVARESASLAFEQVEQQKRGKDTSQTSSRRIEALKKIAEIELKVRELDAATLNFSNERFQKVFAYWVDKLREVAQECLPQEACDLFFNRFATVMENWEEEASAIANKQK